MDQEDNLEESIKMIKSLHRKMSTDLDMRREMDEESRKLSTFDSKDLLKPFTV
jgi:hypothetical protein